MPFTQAELEEIRAADEEIEREFRMSRQEREQSRERDRAAALENKDHRQQKYAQYQKQYQKACYAAHREEIVQYQKACYAAHREEIAPYQKAYYAAHREEIAPYKKA